MMRMRFIERKMLVIAVIISIFMPALFFSISTYANQITGHASTVILGHTTKVLTILIGLCLAAILVIKLWHRANHSMYQMVEILNRISTSKDYSLRIDEGTKGDMGHIAHLINRMLSELSDKDCKLRKRIEDLEKNLRDRTNAFEEAVERRIIAEEAIWLKHHQLLSVISSASAAIAMLDSQFRYLVASNRWKSDYNIVDDITDTDFRSSIPIRPSSWDQACEAALSGETTSSIEDSFVRPDGQLTWLRWTIQPWWANEETVGGTIITSENITELVNARNIAIKTAEIKSQFLANMSHELRTPLNGIIGFSTLLKDITNNPEQAEYSELIRASGEMLLMIVNDVLDLSKLENSAVAVEAQPFSIRELLQRTKDIFSLSAKEKNILLSLELKDDFTTRRIGDNYRIQQVLTNLVGNAIKFTEQGEVKITACPTVQEGGDSRVTFSVIDTGIGIAKEKLTEIFKPFGQADSSVTRRFGGTGLGLTISEKLIEIMNGSLVVDSVVGVGSTFQFTIPLPLEVSTSQEKLLPQTDRAPQRSPDNPERKKLLVAEDNLINQRLVEAILTNAGYEVTLVGTGKLAVEMCQSHSFSLIILDLQMPEMGGIEAARSIREGSVPGERTPIVALTAHAFADDQRQCIEAGMDGYLTKPINRDELLETLNQLIHQNP